MKLYESCPRPAAAREAWKYFVRKNNDAPKRMWKMPTCFRKAPYSIESGAWGLWIADYGDWRDYYDSSGTGQEPKMTNIFSFIKKQTILETIKEKILG